MRPLPEILNDMESYRYKCLFGTNHASFLFSNKIPKLQVCVGEDYIEADEAIESLQDMINYIQEIQAHFNQWEGEEK